MLLVSIPWDLGIGYKFMHFLFDYQHGVIRRGLEGEIMRQLVPPPYTQQFFTRFAIVQNCVALLLFLGVVGLSVIRFSRAVIPVILVTATSPLVFKNMLYDLGRQDIFGLMLVEVVAILCLCGLSDIALAVATITIIPLCLIADNHVFLYIPACFGLLLIANHTQAIIQRKYLWFVAAVGLAVTLSCTLQPPKIPAPAYHQYLMRKVAAPDVRATDGWHNEQWLYVNAKDSFQFTANERKWLIPELKKYPVDYLFAFGCCLAVIVYATSASQGRLRFTYLTSCFIVLFGYAIILFLGSDYARWLANFTACIFLLATVAVAHTSLPIRSWGVLLCVLAGIQLTMHHGFGIMTAVYHGPTELYRLISATSVWKLW